MTTTHTPNDTPQNQRERDFDRRVSLQDHNPLPGRPPRRAPRVPSLGPAVNTVGNYRIGLLTREGALETEVRALSSAAQATLVEYDSAHHSEFGAILCHERALSTRNSHEWPTHSTLIVICEEATTATYRLALQARANRVVELPQDSEWLLETLMTLAQNINRSDQRIIGVIGGCAAAGASCLAGTMALQANQTSHLLIDADPASGGLDLLLGVESEPGLRWHDLSDNDGVLPHERILNSLPRHDGTPILSFGRDQDTHLWHTTAERTISNLSKSVETSVLDLARSHPITPTLAALCHEIYVVVPRQIRALASAKQLLDNLDFRHLPIQVITRGPSPTGIMEQDVSEILGREVVADIDLGSRGQQRLNYALELGAGPMSAAGRGRKSLRHVARNLMSQATTGREAT